MSTVLDNHYDPNYEPTQSEIVEYGKWLGMTLPEDEPLLWLAREGLCAPLPDYWKACKSEKGELYYFNFNTGKSIWDHPMDEHFKQRLVEEKAKLAAGKENAAPTASRKSSSSKKKSEKVSRSSSAANSPPNAESTCLSLTLTPSTSRDVAALNLDAATEGNTAPAATTALAVSKKTNRAASSSSNGSNNKLTSITSSSSRTVIGFSNVHNQQQQQDSVLVSDSSPETTPKANKGLAVTRSSANHNINDSSIMGKPVPVKVQPLSEMNISLSLTPIVDTQAKTEETQQRRSSSSSTNNKLAALKKLKAVGSQGSMAAEDSQPSSPDSTVNTARREAKEKQLASTVTETPVNQKNTNAQTGYTASSLTPSLSPIVGSGSAVGDSLFLHATPLNAVASVGGSANAAKPLSVVSGGVVGGQSAGKLASLTSNSNNTIAASSSSSTSTESAKRDVVALFEKEITLFRQQEELKAKETCDTIRINMESIVEKERQRLAAEEKGLLEAMRLKMEGALKEEERRLAAESSTRYEAIRAENAKALEAFKLSEVSAMEAAREDYRKTMSNTLLSLNNATTSPMPSSSSSCSVLPPSAIQAMLADSWRECVLAFEGHVKSLLKDREGLLLASELKHTTDAFVVARSVLASEQEGLLQRMREDHAMTALKAEEAAKAAVQAASQKEEEARSRLTAYSEMLATTEGQMEALQNKLAALENEVKAKEAMRDRMTIPSSLTSSRQQSPAAMIPLGSTRKPSSSSMKLQRQSGDQHNTHHSKDTAVVDYASDASLATRDANALLLYQLTHTNFGGGQPQCADSSSVASSSSDDDDDEATMDEQYAALKPKRSAVKATLTTKASSATMPPPPSTLSRRASSSNRVVSPLDAILVSSSEDRHDTATEDDAGEGQGVGAHQRRNTHARPFSSLSPASTAGSSTAAASSTRSSTANSPSAVTAAEVRNIVADVLKDLFMQQQQQALRQRRAPLFTSSSLKTVDTQGTEVNLIPSTAASAAGGSAGAALLNVTLPTSFREQHDLLASERQRIVSAKEFLSFQAQEIIERREHLKVAKKQWKRDVIKAKEEGYRSDSQKGQLLKNVHKVLERQANGLAHDEMVLRESNEWLKAKERRLAQLEEQLTNAERAVMVKGGSKPSSASRSNSPTAKHSNGDAANRGRTPASGLTSGGEREGFNHGDVSCASIETAALISDFFQNESLLVGGGGPPHSNKANSTNKKGEAAGNTASAIAASRHADPTAMTAATAPTNTDGKPPNVSDALDRIERRLEKFAKLLLAKSSALPSSPSAAINNNAAAAAAFPSSLQPPTAADPILTRVIGGTATSNLLAEMLGPDASSSRKRTSSSTNLTRDANGEKQSVRDGVGEKSYRRHRSYLSSASAKNSARDLSSSGRRRSTSSGKRVDFAFPASIV